MLVIDGNPTEEDRLYHGVLSDFEKKLVLEGKSVEVVTLREMGVEQCIGCWTCWVKTPGRCFHNDDVEDILVRIVGSELVVFASPIIIGFISALLKRFTDRMIPLVLPYFRVLEGEVHHVPRYENRPMLGALLLADEDTDEEDCEIVLDIYRRNALNLSTELNLYRVFNRDGRELVSL